MISEIINLSIKGRVQDDVAADIMEMEVEEDVDKADVFRVRISIRQQNGGTWTYVDDDRFQVWQPMQVQAGYPDEVATLVDGYITHVDVVLEEDEGNSYLEISGIDTTCLMDLDEKQLAWANKMDHEIALTIFSSYGLNYEVEDTIAEHRDDVSTILQSETDIQFLRRLAARNGFECFVKGKTGYFRSPNMRDQPQKILAAHFGADTNVSSMHIRVDGTPASFVETRRIDPIEKRQEVETLSGSPRRNLGKRPLAELQSGKADGRAFLKRQLAASTTEMKGRLRNGMEGASRFVTVEGDIDGRVYGSVLRSRRLVTVKGAGAGLSGLYYVTCVRHTFSVDEYRQHFKAYRNGIGLTGDEKFGTFSLLPISLPSIGLPGGGASSGSRVLPPQSRAGAPGGF